MTTTPTFREGIESAEEAGARKSFGRSLEYFSLDDGKSIDGRFLTDARPVAHGRMRSWLTVKQHNQMPTRPAPSDLKEGQRWPKAMGGVCRHEKAFTGMFDDCYVCDVYNVSSGKVNKPKDRTWGLFLVREMVMENGVMVGMRDVTEEIEVTGDDGQTRKITRPKILIVNQAWQTFWGHYSTHVDMHGTVLNRDFRIFRRGTELDTDYPPAPFDAVPLDGTTEPLDFRNLAHVEAYDAKYGKDWIPDLGAIVTDKASDEYYARFFDPSKPFPKREGEKASDENAPVKPPSNDPSDEELAALASRVQGQVAPQPPAQPAAPAMAGPAGPTLPG
jgi:hypothetical protein